MTTVFNDFLFFAVGSGSIGLGETQAKTSAGLGGSNPSTDADLGRAAVGSSITHSGLSNALDSGVAGTKGRTWKFSEATANTSTNWHAVAGAGYLDNDAGGTYYPTNNNTDGNYSYSCRAFLRLATPVGGSSKDGGTNVGLFHKGYHADGTTQYGGETQSHENNHTIVPEMNARAGVINAYCLALSTAKITGFDSSTPPRDRGGSGWDSGINTGGARLIIAPGLNTGASSIYSATTNPSIGGVYKNVSKECTGTYNYDTWYHVRFDMVKNGGNDLLIAYTAPIANEGSAADEGLGNETWTEVGRVEIPGGSHLYYRSWEHPREKYSGYWYQAQHNWRNAIYTPDPMIERFQFFTKDVS